MVSREAQLFVGWVSGSVTHAGVGFHASTQPTFILYLIPPTYLLLLDFIEIGFWGFQKGSHRAIERGGFGEGKNWK